MLPLYGNKAYKPYALLYPTPEDIPLGTQCVTIALPDDPSWLGLWIGVMLTLCDPSSFQVFEGAISRETTAEIFSDALIDALTLETLQCEIVEPYWDDPEGDDAASGDDNPAYPFYEDVAVWVIAGFVAYAAGIGAAVEFWTIAEKFRLAFRKNDKGGIVSIFMDAVEIGSVDTYAATPSLGYFDVLSTGTTLRMEVTGANASVVGTPVTQFIRKRLWAGEIEPPFTRWGEDCECVETSFDGGETWTETPTADPRYNPAYLAPPLSGEDARCLAATGMVELVSDTMDAVFDAAAIIDAANAIFALITVFVPGFGLLVRVIILFVEALISIGLAALVLEFDEDTYDELLCIFYQEISEDGQMSALQLEAINTRICAEMSVTICAAMGAMLNMFGWVGFSNAGALYEGSASDCDVCPLAWCRYSDFGTGSTDGWTGYPFPVPPYFDATRWAGTQNAGGTYTSIKYAFASPQTIKSIQFQVGVDTSYPAAGSACYIVIVQGGVATAITGTSYDPPPGISTLGNTGTWANVSEIRLQWQLNGVRTTSIYYAIVEGEGGSNPMGLTNCG